MCLQQHNNVYTSLASMQCFLKTYFKSARKSSCSLNIRIEGALDDESRRRAAYLNCGLDGGSPCGSRKALSSLIS